MVTAQEIARKYEVTSATVYNWVRKGLPHSEKRQGLRMVIMFDPQQVKDWLEENRKEG